MKYNICNFQLINFHVKMEQHTESYNTPFQHAKKNKVAKHVEMTTVFFFARLHVSRLSGIRPDLPEAVAQAG